MPNEPGGAIQVLDNSTAAINQALAQILERVDDLKGLRGPVTIHDRLSVDAPLDPTDAVNLDTLIGDFLGNAGAPFLWPVQGNTQRPGELQGEDSQLDAADPLLWLLTDRFLTPEDTELSPHEPFLWLFGAGNEHGGSEPLTAPPEVETLGAIGAVMGRYAREDHTHTGVNLQDAQTITGAKTFDRDPLAPFGVSASSAVVPNLDSDKWDGQEYTEDSFTITGTGFAADPTATALYVKLGACVALFIPELTGTSDATSFSLTGIPVAIQPTQLSFHTVRIRDNDIFALGLLRLNASSSTVTMFPTVIGGTWTAAAEKTLSACWIIYALL